MVLSCKLDYSELDSCSSNIQKAKDELYECMDFLSVKVMAKLNDLPGSDEQGNIADVKGKIDKKVTALGSKQTALEDFSYALTNLVTTAETADQMVSDKIAELAEPHKEAWSFTEAYRTVTGFLYDVFCVDLPGILTDYCPFLDDIVEFLRGAANSVSHWMDNVVNYFKHGEGKYAMNVVGAFLTVVGAVITVVAAVVGAVTGGFFILAGLAVVLGAVFIVYSLVNFAASYADNEKAEAYARNGRKDLAHYYGSTEGIVDWAEKRDFGDAKENLTWDIVAEAIDTAGKTAEIGLILVNIANSALSLGNVYKPDGKTLDSQKNYSLKNMKQNLQKEYQKIFKKSGVIDDSVVMENGKITDYKLDWTEFLFNGETNTLNDLTGDDSLKQWKAVKKGFDSLKDKLSGEKTGIEGLADKFDSLYEDPSYTDTLDVFSEAFEDLNVGPAKLADERINPVAKLIVKVVELCMPEPEPEPELA